MCPRPAIPARTGPRLTAGLLGGLLAGPLLAAGSGCQMQRTEYRQRPAFYQQDAPDGQSERYVRPDGTVVVYQKSDLRGELHRKSEQKDEEGEVFQIREVSEQGEVTLRCLLPEHVFQNTFTCLVNQEYELIWDQLLAGSTRRAYADNDLGRDDFVEFFTVNRRELAATLNRIQHGMVRNEVVTDRLPGNRTRYRLIPRVASQFRYTAAIIASEQGGMRLVVIE